MMMANANKLAPAYCSISSLSTMAKDDDRSSVSSRSESTSAKSDDIETKKAQAPPAAVTQAQAQAQAPAPRKVLPMQFSQINWQDLEGNREWRTVLCLRGLPACLCQDRALEAYLENCGLGQHVDKVKTAQKSANNGKKLGCAMVRAVSTEAVKELAKFFHGRQMGNSLIAVSFAPSQGLKAAAKQDTPTKIEKPSWEPVKINTDAPKNSSAQKEIPRCPPGLFTRQESASIKGLVDLPPGLEHLLPPPGLEHLMVRKQRTTAMEPAHIRVQ
jgi:hypothetical protein